jgi:hypothetical protein
MGLDGDLHSNLNYTNVGKVKDQPPVKTLVVFSKPAVLCPFTKYYATLDRCRKCSSYGGFIQKGVKIICKWPY